MLHFLRKIWNNYYTWWNFTRGEIKFDWDTLVQKFSKIIRPLSRTLPWVRLLKQVYTILYLNNMQFHPDGCSSIFPVYLLKGSEFGSWRVVCYIINKNKWFIFRAHIWCHGRRISDLVNFFVKQLINLQMSYSCFWPFVTSQYIFMIV